MSENKTGFPSIDKPWLKYYENDKREDITPCMTYYECLWDRNKDHLKDTALVYYGRNISYQELFKYTEELKNAFYEYGIRKGDKVILFTSSTPETVYVILALCRIGAVANMINPLFEEQQIIDRINETEATLLICLDQIYGKIENAIQSTSIRKTVIVPIYNSMPTVLGKIAGIKLKRKINYSSNLVRWNHFVKDNNCKSEDAKWEKDRPLIMVYSSGTTGASKGIVLTNDGLCSMYMHYENPDFQICPYSRGDRMLQMVPVWFSTGIVASILMPMMAGVSAILEPVFSKETFAKDLKKYKPQVALTATSLWIYAAECRELMGVDLSNLKYPISGGEATLPEVEDSINRFLKASKSPSVLIKGYGMCELGATASMESPKNNKVGSSGYPITGVTISAFDMDTDKEMLCGQRGEIRVNTPCRMKGYFKNDKATSEFFYIDEDGGMWGKTGDIGYVDEDGFVFILGRGSDSFISTKGNRIYNFDIETVIRKNEIVKDCEVVEILNSCGEKVPVAQIIVKNEHFTGENELIQQLDQLCKMELSEDMIPAGYKVVGSFPVKNNGKRDMEAIKSDVKDMIWI